MPLVIGEKLQEYTIDRESFRQWLASQSPDALVGWVRNAHNCPIAKYTKELEGCSTSVGLNTISMLRHFDKSEHVLPPWAQRFVWEVDKLHSVPDESRVGAFAVSAKQALTTLDDIA